MVWHPLRTEVAVLGRMDIVPQGNEAVSVLIAGLFRIGRVGQRLGLWEFGHRDFAYLDSLLAVTGSGGGRLAAGRRRRSSGLLLLHGRDAGANPQHRRQPGKRNLDYSHPINSTSSTQKSKLAPALLTCHCRP